MFNFFLDLKKYINFKKNEHKYDYFFFNENEFTFQYLKKIIEKKNIKNNVLLLSLEKIDNYKSNQLNLKNSFILKLFFLTLKIKFVYTTSTDLNNSIFLRSKVKKNNYIFIQHSTASLSMIYNNKAFLEFDAVQVINKSQYKDLNHINKFYKKKIKPIVSSYKFLETINKDSNIKKIECLIAPTWHTNFYELNLHNKLFDLFDKNNISFEFRPHFMSIKKKEFIIEKEFFKFMNLEKLLNFKKYQYLITDWSGIFLEFAIINKTKPFLLNTRKKVLNTDYETFPNLPIEISSRNEVGLEFNTLEISKISDFILKAGNVGNSEDEKNIDLFYKNNFYH